MKKAVIIMGSPRKNCNTHILVEEAARGLADSGLESEVFFLNDMNIKGCQACYYCKKHNTAKCCVNDDMQKLHAAINEAAGIIVAAPIYFGDVSAQTKIWLDRMFPYIDIKVQSLLPQGKTASFIFTQNQKNPNLFTAQINAVMQMLGFIGFTVKDSLLASNLDFGNKPPVTEYKEYMDKAYHIGKNLI